MLLCHGSPTILGRAMCEEVVLGHSLRPPLQLQAKRNRVGGCVLTGVFVDARHDSLTCSAAVKRMCDRSCNVSCKCGSMCC
jgi:hypothetical protein